MMMKAWAGQSLAEVITGGAQLRESHDLTQLRNAAPEKSPIFFHFCWGQMRSETKFQRPTLAIKLLAAPGNSCDGVPTPL